MTELRRSLRPLLAAGIALFAGVGIGVAAIYGMGGFEGNGAAGLCRESPERAKAIAATMAGEVAAMIPSTRPVSLSSLAFHDPDGRARTLADWHGRIVLLNLWATWCPPCKEEMPALDALQGARGSPRFEVVTVNIDTNAADKRVAFLNEVGIRHLSDHTDRTLGIFKALQSVGLSRGMPTTVLVDGDGCELGTMNGPAPWDKPDAARLVEAALALPPAGGIKVTGAPAGGIKVTGAPVGGIKAAQR